MASSVRRPGKIGILLGAVAAFVLALSAIAVAATIQGTSGPDEITGTQGPDQINGAGGNDEIESLCGNDEVFGGLGNDNIDSGGNVPSCGLFFR